ncbi:MAG: PHB depolymerase family esterase, partial [Oscillospiraceae bacterium]|nr:PHB depolymerase family esterase [Oscillospiraceae bacterium]
MKSKTTFKFRTVAWMLILMLLMAPFATLSAFADDSGTFTSGTYNGRNYKVYIPSSYVSGTSVPLMVMLHGGTQDPTVFATGTQMNALAEEEDFIVLYPEQPSSANSSKCWNWFLPEDQSRGSGEPALIVGMVNQIKSQYSIDNSRVFVAGLSAGAAMSVILGAAYPDVFSGIGVASGLEYKAATDMIGAFSAMSSGGPAPATQGQLAYNAMGSYASTVPVIVFQGSSDYTVYPVNGNQVLSQWAKTNDLADDGSANGSIDDTADATYTGTADVANGKNYTRYVYNDSNNNIIMEKYIVTGMGHAWSGGSSSGSYTDPTGPDCSLIMYNFFMSVTGGATVVDKSQLQSAVNAAAAVDLSLYTAASAASVTTALNTANTVLADEDATQAQVDAAASGLNSAVAALVELTPTVDKSQLQSAVNTAAAIDLSLYTAASAASVTAALNTANTVLADED